MSRVEIIEKRSLTLKKDRRLKDGEVKKSKGKKVGEDGLESKQEGRKPTVAYFRRGR